MKKNQVLLQPHVVPGTEFNPDSVLEYVTFTQYIQDPDKPQIYAQPQGKQVQDADKQSSQGSKKVELKKQADEASVSAASGIQPSEEESLGQYHSDQNADDLAEGFDEDD